MGKIKDNLWKQHRVGEIWGRFALAGSQIAIFISAYTAVMVTVNAYEPVSEWLMTFGVYLRLWVFMTIALVPIVVAYLFAWKFLVSTYYRSSVVQFWKEGKEWADKIDKIPAIEKKLDDILAELKKK